MIRKIQTIKKRIAEVSKNMDGQRAKAIKAWRDAIGNPNGTAVAAYDMGLATGYADAVAALDSLQVFIDFYVASMECEGEGNND